MRSRLDRRSFPAQSIGRFCPTSVAVRIWWIFAACAESCSTVSLRSAVIA